MARISHSIVHYLPVIRLFTIRSFSIIFGQNSSSLSKSIFLIAALLLSFAAFPQYWQQQVNYTIDVTLNDKEHTLDGFEKIEYINNSPDTFILSGFISGPMPIKMIKQLSVSNY